VAYRISGKTFLKASQMWHGSSEVYVVPPRVKIYSTDEYITGSLLWLLLLFRSYVHSRTNHDELKSGRLLADKW